MEGIPDARNGFLSAVGGCFFGGVFPQARWLSRLHLHCLLPAQTGQPRFFSTGVEDVGDHTFTLVIKVAVPTGSGL